MNQQSLRDEFEDRLDEFHDAIELGIHGDPDAARSRLLELWDGQEARLKAIDNERLDFAERGMKAESEVERLRASVLTEDDSSTDATDFAHPAWWRGNDAGVYATVAVIQRALDNGLDGGVSGYRPLQKVRERIARLRESALTAREATALLCLGVAGERLRDTKPAFNGVDFTRGVQKLRDTAGSPKEEERKDG